VRKIQGGTPEWNGSKSVFSKAPEMGRKKMEGGFWQTDEKKGPGSVLGPGPRSEGFSKRGPEGEGQ